MLWFSHPTSIRALASFTFTFLYASIFDIKIFSLLPPSKSLATEDTLLKNQSVSYQPITYVSFHLVFVI